MVHLVVSMTGDGSFSGNNPTLVNSQIKIKEEPIEEYSQIQQPITNKTSINELKKLASKLVWKKQT